MPINGCRTHASRSITFGQIHIVGYIRADIDKERVRLPKPQVFRLRELLVSRSARSIARGRVRKGPQDHTVDDGEDGGIGSDAECQCQEGDRREDRAAA